MLSTGNINYIASGIYEELGEPSGIGLPYISGWLTYNLGTLNVLLGTTYFWTGGNVIGTGFYDSGNISPLEIAIYKNLFFSKWYQREMGRVANAAGYDDVFEIQDEESRVRRITKTDMAKVFADQKRIADAELKNLVYTYRSNKAQPLDIKNDGVPIVDIYVL